jgi:hypothetical protein
MRLFLAQQESSVVYTESFRKFFDCKSESYSIVWSNIPNYSSAGYTYILHSIYRDWLDDFNISNYEIIIKINNI